MGFVGSMLSNDKGAGFQGKSADIQNPATTDQANQLYNQAQGGIESQRALLGQVSNYDGSQNLNNVFNQLQGAANGTGPNPAAAALNQATAANTANQAALMAGQRGSSANAGLIARQAAQQGSANQQNAIGQAATMQAQQQINAMGQLSGIANQQVANQQNATNAYNSSLQGEQNNILGAIQGQNNANVGMQSNINSANANIAGINAQTQGKMVGGLLNGASSALAAANGGMIAAPASQPSGPRSFVGKHINGQSMALAKGGQIPMKPMDTSKPAQNMTSGGKVPGKAKFSGDTLKNDVVPAMLTPQEIVIPKSISTAKDAPKKAAAFVAAVLAKQGLKK